MTRVIKVNPSQLRYLLELLTADPAVRILETKSQYEEFRLGYSGVQIIAYSSGKVVITGESALGFVRDTILGMDDEDSKYDFIIGSDETGKGEFIGPLVVTAVALDATQSKFLRAAGVMDSKEVPPHRIRELASVISETCSSSSTVLISPERFNEQFEEFHAEGKNLNDLLAWAHARAISEVYSSLNQTTQRSIRIVVDEFDRVKTELRLSRVLNMDDVKLEQKHGAEDVIAVAAASILARNNREEWIDSAEARLGLDLRSFSREAARQHPDAHLFSKIRYLGK